MPLWRREGFGNLNRACINKLTGGQSHIPSRVCLGPACPPCRALLTAQIVLNRPRKFLEVSRNSRVRPKDSLVRPHQKFPFLVQESVVAWKVPTWDLDLLPPSKDWLWIRVIKPSAQLTLGLTSPRSQIQSRLGADTIGSKMILEWSKTFSPFAELSQRRKRLQLISQRGSGILASCSRFGTSSHLFGAPKS